MGLARIHWGAPRGRRVHSGSGGFTRAGVVGFIRVSVGSVLPALVSPSSHGFTGALHGVT